MSKKHSPPDCYAPEPVGRPRTYPKSVYAGLTEEQRDFIDSECRKLCVKPSEYIRLIIQDLMDQQP